MTRFMLPALLALILSAPAYADAVPAAVKDQTAIDKDNAEIEKNSTALARDQAMRDQNKASGNWAGQAVNTLSIGYDQFLIGEKKAEKSVDEEIMNHDTK